MSSRKDIILICLAALLLVAASVFAAAKLGMVDLGVGRPVVLDPDSFKAKYPELTLAPKGAVYPSTQRPSLEDQAPDIGAPEENEDGWAYDFFTTINIAWDPVLKEYIPRDRKVIPLPPFGVALVKIGHPIYPYVLRSTLIGRKGREEIDRTFSLENIETKQYFDGCRIGKPLDANTPVIPISFGVVREKDSDGFMTSRSVLKLEDRNLGRTVEIDDVKPLEFADRLDILLVSTSEPDKTWTFHAVGDKFTYNDALYQVKSVDLGTKSVTLDKTFAPNPRKPKKTFTEVLTVPSAKPAAPAAPTPAATTPAPAVAPAAGNFIPSLPQ
ncbi:MAG: hypothetical protein ACO3ND_04870 [Opitutales bacterium]